MAVTLNCKTIFKLFKEIKSADAKPTLAIGKEITFPLGSLKEEIRSPFCFIKT
jgi:hypothetical protein